jgi:hypothetical protein
MATGLIAWTCMLMASATSATPDEVYYMKQRGFLIPITVRPDQKANLRELVLFASRDQGGTWEIVSRAQPDATTFNFTAEKDGMVYFTIAVVDRAGKMDPPDPQKALVNQKIYIDTTKPVVHIMAAERVADEIQVSWEAQDEKPDSTSLRLEWRLASGSQWTPLPIQPGIRGNQRVRPGVPGDVVLRISMRDIAGNESSEERTVPGATMTTSLDRAASQGNLIPTGGQEFLPPPLPTPSPVSVAPSPVMRQPEPAPYSPMPTRGPLKPLQIVNKKSLKLEFDVSKVGPSGLGSVDIYVTTDEGATWQKSTADPAVSLPVSAEMRGVGPQKGSVTVALPNDGVIYGYYLVVKSRAGLGKAGPKSGDAPQVRVEVDTTQPLAELYQPQPDNTRPNALVLTWKAEDRNLGTNNPISLEWSEQGRDWHSIGETTLPNTGRFTWTVPANIPPKVLLKLTVRDTAGNVAVAQTSEPVLIDLTEPEVTGVSIAGR